MIEHFYYRIWLHSKEHGITTFYEIYEYANENDAKSQACARWNDVGIRHEILNCEKFAIH